MLRIPYGLVIGGKCLENPWRPSLPMRKEAGRPVSLSYEASYLARFEISGYSYSGRRWMRKVGVGIGLVWLVFSAAGLAQDKEHHAAKAGLWEITSTMTWLKAPATPGTPGGPPPGGTHTTSVCLTQEMVDAGALLPQSRGQCRIENKVIKPGSVTADYVCVGKMKGKGLLSATYADLEHATGSVHFQGTFEIGSQPKPIEWTTVSNSVFKGAQCSNVQPSVPGNAPK